MSDPMISDKSGQRHVGPAQKKPLIIFSPWPPSENGIATYVAELMPCHLSEFDVTLVIADDAPMPPDVKGGPRILLASEFRRHRRVFETTPKLYHIGNNPDHCYMLDFLASDPGLVVLHDFNLNYLHETATLGWREKRGYVSALQLEYGALGSDEVRRQFESKHRGLFATYELPLNGDVLEAATGVIAHSFYVQHKVAARVPRTPIWRIPHHLSPAVQEYDGLTKAKAREQLGLPANEIIVTALGFATYAKRLPMVLKALADLRPQLPPFRFVLAGQRLPDQYDVDADIDAFGLRDVALCTDYIDEDSFFKHLVACDLVVNLRYPSGGETSGTLIRALGMGVPTVVLDYGPLAELPNNVVRKVPWGQETQVALTHVLQSMMLDLGGSRAMGAHASAHIRRIHDITESARRYSEIIRGTEASIVGRENVPHRQYFPNPREIALALQHLGSDATAKVRSGAGAIWWRSSATPLGHGDHRALVVSARPAETAELLSGLFEWPAGTVNFMTEEDFLGSEIRDGDGSPLADGTFTLALAVVREDLAEERACLLMRRLNASLRHGGVLIIEVASDPAEIRSKSTLGESMLEDRLVDAGFTTVRQISPQDSVFADLPLADYDETLEYRYSCFSGRKASKFSAWRFVHNVSGTPMRLGGRIG